MKTAKPANFKILICGDSFAADWTVKYPGQGWPNILAEQYQVKNVAQAGCSEYRIYQQIKKENLKKFDAVIVWHTSPYRIPVPQHPVHGTDSLHHGSDFLYADVASMAKTRPELQCVVDYFEKYFDIEHAKFVYSMTVEKIAALTQAHPNVIHIAAQTDLEYPGVDLLDFYDIWQQHSGLMNHLDTMGNKIVLEKIKEKINEQATI